MMTVAAPEQLPQCDVLAFGPHPDDIEIGCGGTLLLLLQGGHSVALVDCTRGEMGSRGTVHERATRSKARTQRTRGRWSCLPEPRASWIPSWQGGAGALQAAAGTAQLGERTVE